MSTQINRETRLPYLKSDPFTTRVRQSHFKYDYDWRWEYVELLKRRQYEQAAKLRKEAENETDDHV